MITQLFGFICHFFNFQVSVINWFFGILSNKVLYLTDFSVSQDFIDFFTI